jgi:hypothetical protein
MSLAAAEKPTLARRELKAALAMAEYVEFPQAAEAKAALTQIEALSEKD